MVMRGTGVRIDGHLFEAPLGQHRMRNPHAKSVRLPSTHSTVIAETQPRGRRHFSRPPAIASAPRGPVRSPSGLERSCRSDLQVSRKQRATCIDAEVILLRGAKQSRSTLRLRRKYAKRVHSCAVLKDAVVRELRAVELTTEVRHHVLRRLSGQIGVHTSLCCRTKLQPQEHFIVI